MNKQHNINIANERYPFPGNDSLIFKRWRPDNQRIQDLSCPHQQLLCNTVKAILDEGYQYNSGLLELVKEKLGDYFDSSPTDFESTEIYCARKIYDFDSKFNREQSVIHLAQVGQKYKNVYLSPNKYSTALVEAVYPETGQVTLLLTKRGTKNRWRSTCSVLNIIDKISKDNIKSDDKDNSSNEENFMLMG